MDYYSNFEVRVATGLKTLAWHKLERGIITSCTISAILFAIAMNMVIKSAEKKVPRTHTKNYSMTAVGYQPEDLFNMLHKLCGWHNRICTSFLK